ncbi:MAG: type II secretion system F family protein [Pirellula sp.]|jgi:type II secretory pathway component PulF|nr:type II secretion system F family protein [Pirellula sp.]
MPLTNSSGMIFSSFSPWRAISFRKRDDFAIAQLFVLRTIKTALDCNESIPDMLTAAAFELRGGARRDLLKLVQQIQSAGSLATACEQFPSLLDEETVLAIRLGEQLKILPMTLADLIDLQHNRCLSKVHNPQSEKFYWASFAFVFFFFWFFIMYFIAPTMKKMLEEFEIATPGLTLVLFRVSKYAVMYWPIFVFGAVCLAISCISPRTERWMLSLFGFVRPIRWFQSPSGISKQLLALAMENQKPLHTSLSTLAKYHFHADMRKRLLVARNDIELGTESWQAIESCGLLSTNEAAFLKTHSDNRLQAYLLRQLAAEDWRQRDRLIAFRSLLIQPTLTLIFGGFVALFAVGLFLALVVLIQTMT